ncbi:hypothetical protein F4808DRAFT_440965 [Astrocystis sublimbata]|nr:hypothetical protein F4808DRAFT_440965 [Astrocystis sublimbata]
MIQTTLGIIALVLLHPSCLLEDNRLRLGATFSTYLVPFDTSIHKHKSISNSRVSHSARSEHEIPDQHAALS